ncbi:MAG TPA: EscU/YscU/HrcU family type III secretion system export apparatus switch protein, partial [Pirellulales bacterium]
GPTAGSRLIAAARRAWTAALAPDGLSSQPASLVSEAISFVGVEVFASAGPILALVVGAALLAEAAQVGLLWLPERLSLDFTRLDPVAGWSRIVSLDSVRRLGSGLLGIAFAGAFFAYRVQQELPVWASLSAGGPTGLLELSGERWPWLLVEGAAVLLAWGVVDYAIERLIHEQRLNMTPAEMKEEMRDAVGDPTILAARKKRRRQKPREETPPTSAAA